MFKVIKLFVLLLISVDSFSQLYVDSKNDSRLKSYNDSLYLYNYTLRQRQFVAKYLNQPKYYMYKNAAYNKSLKDTAAFWLSLDHTINKNYNFIEPLCVEKPILLMIFVSSFNGNLLIKQIHWAISVYKKPVINVIYKPREYYNYINGPNGIMIDKDFIARYGYENYVKYFKIN